MIDPSQQSQILDLSKKHFPFPTPNPGQLEVIVSAVTNLLLGKKHIVIEAPTGVGKSAIAQTIHLVMKELRGKYRTGIITATNGLQDQYKKDMPRIEVLKGSTNYSCKHGTEGYGCHNCIAKTNAKTNGCSPERDCDYVIARNFFLNEADFRITNNSYQIIAPVEFIANEETIVDLLICDESHELEMAIIDHSAITISMEDAKILMTHGLTAHYNNVDNIFKYLMSKKSSETFFIDNAYRDFIETNLYSKMSSMLTTLFYEVQKHPSKQDLLDYVQKMVTGLGLLMRRPEMIVTKSDDKSIEIKPVYASDVAEQALFSKANQFIHMSATICGFSQYVKCLGLENSNWTKIEIDNPIPAENRKIVVFPMFSLGREFDNWKPYYHLMNRIVEKHSGESGIIHTPSFDLARKLESSLGKQHASRAIVSNKRTEIMEHLRTKGNIVISPSVAQGYDFKDDLARWQIIAKIPFGYLGDPHIKLNSKRNPKWYKRNAILKTVQSSGRVVRGVNDFGITYVLDASILRMFDSDADLFPEWFLDAVMIANK
jgi:ATP-dependent DNA helicase DinG